MFIVELINLHSIINIHLPAQALVEDSIAQAIHLF